MNAVVAALNQEIIQYTTSNFAKVSLKLFKLCQSLEQEDLCVGRRRYNLILPNIPRYTHHNILDYPIIKIYVKALRKVYRYILS